MRVVVVGAGIGGLAAAVALRTIGAETLVIERAASIREVGAGLSIWSNAVNALRELGLEENVMASASVIERNLVQTTNGSLIARTELGEVSQMAGAACVCIHRAGDTRLHARAHLNLPARKFPVPLSTTKLVAFSIDFARADPHYKWPPQWNGRLTLQFHSFRRPHCSPRVMCLSSL